MGLADRIILTIYTFALAFLSLVSILLALGWSVPQDAFNAIMQTQPGRVTLGLVSLLFFVVSVRLLYFAFNRPNRHRAVVHEAELGEVRISLEAVESLVARVARGIKGVRDVRPLVRENEGQLDVRLRVWVSPDISIPDITKEMQDEIARYVRNVVGVGVGHVQTFVENITTEARKGRVE